MRWHVPNQVYRVMSSSPHLVTLTARSGSSVGRVQLVARHFFDDTVSFMHPHSPSSIVLGCTDAHMPSLFSVTPFSDEEHTLEGALELGNTEPVDIGFDLHDDEIDDELGEHIALDTDDPLEEVGRTLVVRFIRAEDGGADCDYLRIDVPLEDACQLVPADEAIQMRADSQAHHDARDHLDVELVGAARRVGSAGRRAMGAIGRAGRGVKKAAKATGRGVKKAGRGVKKAANATGRFAKKGADRLRSKVSQLRNRNSRATASKGLGEIAAKGKAKQAALKQQREKPLPKTPEKKAPVKPQNKKPPPPSTAKGKAAQKKAAAKSMGKSKAKKKAGVKKAAAATAKQPGGGGLGLPGAGTPGGGAAESPGGGGLGAGGGESGGGGGGGAPMGPMVVPAGSSDDVPPRTAFVNIVAQPVDGNGPLEFPDTVFDDPYAAEEQFFDEDPAFEDLLFTDEGQAQVGGEYSDEEDEEDDYFEVELMAAEMADRPHIWARAIAPEHKQDLVRKHLEALAWSESCYEPHVYSADIAAALLA